MLKRGAAELWGVPLVELVARDAKIEHPKTNRSATYGQLVKLAASQSVPKVRLKEPKQFRWIGKSIDRLDARTKVDGSAIYGIDVRLPGMLTAAHVEENAAAADMPAFGQNELAQVVEI